jgi:hypothetical protein
VAFNAREFQHAPFDEDSEVGVEEGRAASPGSPDSLRETAGDRPFQIVALAQLRCVRDTRPLSERGVDEAIRAAVQLSLGERP